MFHGPLDALASQELPNRPLRRWVIHYEIGCILDCVESD
jgi:hypothetical protein